MEEGSEGGVGGGLEGSEGGGGPGAGAGSEWQQRLDVSWAGLGGRNGGSQAA